jgi:hypothetical protein
MAANSAEIRPGASGYFIFRLTHFPWPSALKFCKCWGFGLLWKEGLRYKGDDGGNGSSPHRR